MSTQYDEKQICKTSTQRRRRLSHLFVEPLRSMSKTDPNKMCQAKSLKACEATMSKNIPLTISLQPRKHPFPIKRRSNSYEVEPISPDQMACCQLPEDDKVNRVACLTPRPRSCHSSVLRCPSVPKKRDDIVYDQSSPYFPLPEKLLFPDF